MPFTISHAAAVLPFARPLARWRLLSAAVIGSMAPDFGFFSPWRPARFETHSLDALITFCLPAGLAAYWLFQTLIRTPILELLPPGAYARWRGSAAPADYRSFKQWLFAALGILAGALTHLVWDAFTHEGARGVRMIPALDDPVEIGSHHFGGSRLLQDGSSILGLIAVFAVLIYSLRPGRPEDQARPRRLAPRARHLWILAYVLVAVALSVLFFLLRHRSPPFLTASALGNAAIAVLRGMGAALVAVSAALAPRLQRRRAAGAISALRGP
jgi:uncharacterized protein DUF4184